MPVSYPTYADYVTAFQLLFQGLSKDKMHIANLSIRLRVQEQYEATPHALKTNLLASLDDPAIETNGIQRPDPAAVYAQTTAGMAERAVAQDMTALADSFDAATRAMKQAIINFVAVDIRDLLYIDESLTTQTVNGMLTILDELYGEMPASQQHALATSLRVPFNPRAETVTQFLSNIRHARTTLSKVGLIFSDEVFSEYVCTAIIAGAPEFAPPLDYYRNTSDARDLPRLYRIIHDRAATIATNQANAIHTPDHSAAVPNSSISPSANAMLPANVTNNNRGRGGRRSRGGRGRQGRSSTSRGSRLPDHEVAALASQLQNHFRIQAQRYPAAVPAPNISQPYYPPRGSVPARDSFGPQAAPTTRPRYFGAHSTIEQPDDASGAPWEWWTDDN